MPRRKRIHIPGFLRHITHRCHKKEHLLKFKKDRKGRKELISKSMQLMSGATGQAYNSRKNCKGAFWEDRFYTTAIESGVHLLRCMAYIELNMVRAGAVKHPRDWKFCGYNKILDPPRRYGLIDRKALLSC